MRHTKKDIFSSKSGFQKELEKSVSRKIAMLVVAGGLLFCAAILGINMLNREYNKERHLRAVSDTFEQVCDVTQDFLTEEANTGLFVRCAAGEAQTGEVRYLLSKYNVDAPVRLNMILTDAGGNPVFTSFSKETMNLHRTEFNRIVAENAKKRTEPTYNAVYYFSGDTSEYVFSMPLYEGQVYAGNAAVYLNGGDWGALFSEYQYDAVITNQNGDIIFCSNTGFLPERNTNKYREEDGKEFLWVNHTRYATDYKVLKDRDVIVHSFLYSPRNYIYAVVGVITILALGIIWTVLFFRMSSIMAARTSASVRLLVDEMRIIRKEDKEHVVRIETGDEFEEIADQINRMVRSINELNAKNIELLTINGRMEMQNLQAQINPHFIYNTLDNIKYLIANEPMRAAQMIERFTHILRYSIDNTKRRVTLEEDMRYIEDYLVIQKMRFGDRFAYSVAIAQEYDACMIPKLLLQPLLENSIKYGFQKKMELQVAIRGRCEDGYLLLSVVDNGAGVPRSTLETLRAMLASSGADTTHNGLQNISRRIALEYGRESGMLLDSVDGEEFRVTLKLWMGESADVQCTVGGG